MMRKCTKNLKFWKSALTKFTPNIKCGLFLYQNNRQEIIFTKLYLFSLEPTEFGLRDIASLGRVHTTSLRL